jgi:hypothetical protein
MRASNLQLHHWLPAFYKHLLLRRQAKLVLEHSCWVVRLVFVVLYGNLLCVGLVALITFFFGDTL